MRIVRAALPWTVAAGAVGAAVLVPLRGTDAAASALLAAAMICGNALLSAGISALAGKLTPTGPAMFALPSFAFRMAAVLAVLRAVEGRAFVDEPVFAITFGSMLAFTLFLEARAFKRTPWLALTFGTKERQ